MHSKLQNLYHFLLENNNYPAEMQYKNRVNTLSPFIGNSADMAYALLHDNFYTQSIPNLDKAANFFEKISKKKNSLLSFENFCKQFGKYDEKSPFKSLFQSLIQEEGWGKKTTALFVKNVYVIHDRKELKRLRFWNDVPKFNPDVDEMYVPVDKVIKEIFSQRLNPKLNSFSSINKSVKNIGETVVWDDLWFWGFLTQKGSDSPRELGFNKGKYWLLINTDKNPEIIRTIERKCNQFISILEGKN